MKLQIRVANIGKNTGVDCHALLQRIFLTQGLNTSLFLSPVLADGFFTTSATWEAQIEDYFILLCFFF